MIKPTWFSNLLIVINGFLYLVVIGLWLTIPQETYLNFMTMAFTVGLSMGILIVERERFKTIYQSIWFKKFSSQFITCLLVFSILSLINFISYKHPLSFDLTSLKRNSLSDMSIKVLDNRNVDSLDIRIFARKAEMAQIKALAELYRLKGRNVSITEINADNRPDLIKKYKIQKVPALVVGINGKFELAEQINELGITNAILKLSNKRKPKILFTTGHGEKDIKDNSGEGISGLKQLLETQNFEVFSQNLLMTPSIDLKTDILAIWGPKNAFEDETLLKIQSFLNGGGNLIVALDPELNGDPHKKLRAFLNDYGIDILNVLVLDKQNFANGSEGKVPIIQNFSKKHVISRNMRANETVFFPLTTAVRKVKESKIIHSPLLLTSEFPKSWGESDFFSLVESGPEFNDKTDEPGPLSVWSSFEDLSKKIRVITAGNSTLVTNRYGSYAQNFKLFYNSINWLAYDDQLVSLNTPVLKDSRIFINSHQLGGMFYFCVLLLPLFFFSIAIYLAFKNRQLG